MDSLRNYLERILRIFIFYIVLHAATSALEYGYARDLDDQEFTNYARQSKQTQILGNIHSLFNKRTSDNNENRESIEDYNDFNYNPNKKNKQQFDEALAEVTSALYKIKEELIKFNNDGDLTVENTVTKSEKRYKRDVADDTVANVTSAEQNVTITVTTTEKPETVTEQVEVLPVQNETVTKEHLTPNDDLINKNDSRRTVSMMAPPLKYVTPTNSKVKDKLLAYLTETFNDVERKLMPLTNLKIALSNDNHYKIGYIIATIDTLDVSLKKLKNDMDLHQYFWTEEKILDLFDRLNTTNTVVTSLIQSLKLYLPSN